MNKKNLGQFNTTNVEYILQGFENVFKDKNVIDPFAGNCDLLKFANKNNAISYFGFDIDPKYINDIVKDNDSLINIPIVGNFILTNPPYLAKNKMSKDLKNKYNCEDFYLLAIEKIIETDINEGILILPVNFLSAENSTSIRTNFLSKYIITKINYFKNQVFEDTTYNIIAFHFIRDGNKEQILNFNIFPDNNKFSCKVKSEFGYRIAGKELNEIISCKNVLKIKRLTEDIMNENVGCNISDGYFNDLKTKKTYNINDIMFNKLNNNIIILKCIDGKEDLICAEDIAFHSNKFLVGKNSSRNIAYLIIEDISLSDQRKLIKKFNEKLFELREKYNSLFLTNFRDNNRKRISFEFCYKLLNYCYEKGL